MKPSFFLPTLFAVVFAVSVQAQSLNTRREIEKANKETFPEGVKKIERDTGAKVTLEVDAASMGDDAKVWSSLYLIVNRVTGAFQEIGKDQIGKDALAKGVKKVVIVKHGAEAKEDGAELKDGTLTVKSSVDDASALTVQDVIQKALEKSI